MTSFNPLPPKPDKPTTVLVVDDQPDFARGLARLISGHFPDIVTLTAESGKAALDLLGRHTVHLLITDLRMPEMSGTQLVAEAMRHQPGVSIVVLSAYGTIETAVEALRAGAYDFLTKPIESEQLFRVINKGLERNHLLTENRTLRSMLVDMTSLGELVGEGPAILQLRRSIRTIARSGYNVLVRGESGTGKELVAGLIHRLSPRAEKPFIVVDCPSIPDNLLESELFGYVKGAFTGADRDHQGLFSAAHGGTLHLDEIGDISTGVQTKLLRCLQSGEVRPVGAGASRLVDVRVVASTNRDLEAGLRDKSFREDLYYRLNVLTLSLPALRERVEDIPLLVRHFLKSACHELNLPEHDISPEALQWITSRPWPGNVRELQNFLRRTAVFCSDGKIDRQLVERLQPQMVATPFATDPCLAGLPAPLTALSYKEAKEMVVDDFTRRYTDGLLQQTRGNISEAARLSGLSRVALQKILLRLGTSASSFR
jgi:DNA-binding NtrC family response regulator